ncbi:hypothetical protein [Dehalobacterium formicoaceticum]|uniref:Uncharacterized protein n=1 Tax=Dehalobacterium formicoaceticum TaxID=51515 RepID=A0ABT1Y626_9FIRM|nr:hypothetical protein [Dehalobacterium formicoaceticum]MCR6546334.1 hypothetical protein [Dehalobacterium formicoaceticum]
MAFDKAKNQGTEIPPAVVAAITASLCAMIGKPASEFTYKSIQRVSGRASRWSMAGTADLILSRQRILERGNS